MSHGDHLGRRAASTGRFKAATEFAVANEPDDTTRAGLLWAPGPRAQAGRRTWRIHSAPYAAAASRKAPISQSEIYGNLARGICRVR